LGFIRTLKISGLILRCEVSGTSKMCVVFNTATAMGQSFMIILYLVNSEFSNKFNLFRHFVEVPVKLKQTDRRDLNQFFVDENC
jgi:hypothetical protein